jgi:hypothetical protein
MRSRRTKPLRAPFARMAHLTPMVMLACCALAALPNAACSKSANDAATEIPATPVSAIPGHASLEDDSHKEGPRLMPAETFIRSYLSVFGGLAPLDLQAKLQGTDGAGLFDTWRDYLAALGMPEYMNEVARSTQTNALMIATFERTGVALCDRAAQLDLVASTPVAKRVVFAFDLPAGEIADADFAPRFDVLHRAFLGMPASAAPADRTAKLLALYRGTVARHTAAGAPSSKLTPQQAGWSSVCQGLIRHPEFHLY